MSEIEKAISATRIRVGVFLIILFWLPIWLTVPALAGILGIQNESGRQKLLFSILIVQGILGLIGILLTGKEIVKIVRTTQKRKVLKVFWHILIHGNFEGFENYAKKEKSVNKS